MLLSLAVRRALGRIAAAIRKHGAASARRLCRSRLRPPGPLEARAAAPPDSQARCHWYADFVLTRSSPATWIAPIPCSYIPTACSRTLARRDRPSAVSPPPSGHLMTPA